MTEMIDNRYRIIKTLGSGLSGEVLAVKDQEGEKALKFLKRVQLNVSRDEALNNFKNEFSILSELNHPGIARILDFGFDSHLNKYYFTTELIAGTDFYTATEDQPNEVIEDLVVQVLRALTYLHSRGVYHLDIKPQNILVSKNGKNLVAKIIDFGLAGFSSPRKKVGTPAYMAPEIILGSTLDGRTDLYAFGVLLYKVLTRENPFASKNIREVFDRHQNFVPKLPSEVKNQIHKYWDKIVLRALAKKPSDRYPDGTSMIRDINFLAHKNYEMETADTRLSYLPEKGNLIGRRKEVAIFKNLFEMIFSENNIHTSRLFICSGKTGTGKSRFLSECKYHSQLNNIPVYDWKGFQEQQPKSPFCLQIDEQHHVSPAEVNLILQQFTQDKVLILWATQKAPSGWGHCEIIELKNFTEEELTQYIIMVIGLTDPPKNFIKQIFQRTDGNPLFVTELLKTMLGNNLLLDASGRWNGSTFEDIGINFDKIQVPETLAGLLEEKFERLDRNEKTILKYIAIMGHPLSIQTLLQLTKIQQPQSSLLYLTKEDLIQRTDREHHYYFNNVLMRDVITNYLSDQEKEAMHDEVAAYFKNKPECYEEHLYHLGHGTNNQLAIESLKELGQQNLRNEKFSIAVTLFEQAWQRAKKEDQAILIQTESCLAEGLVYVHDYKKAISHYQHLKELYDHQDTAASLQDRIKIYDKLGDLYTKLDEPEKALQLFNTTLEWLQNTPQSHVDRLIVQNHIATVYMKSGKVDEAEKIFRENHKTWEQKLNFEEKKSVTNNWLVDVLVLKKEYAEAMEQIQKDETFFEEMEDRYLMARAAYVKGDLLFKQMLNITDPEKAQLKQQAIKSFEKSLQLSKEIGAYDMMLRAYNGIGNLHYYEKEYEKTAEDYQRALALARKLEDYQTAATVALNLGNIYKIENKHNDAYSYLIYAINTLENLENKNAYNWLHLFNSHIEIAETYRHMEELVKAEEALEKAEQIMRAHSHLASYEFWLWLERAKVYHVQNHKSLLNEAIQKAKKFTKQGIEIEELNKFQEIVKSGTVLEQATPKLTIPWHLKAMKIQNNETSVSELETILQINKFLNSEHDPEHLLKMVLNYALELSKAESGLVILLNEENNLEIKASVNTVIDADLTLISKSIARHTLETGEIIVSADALSDGRFDSSESIVINELKSVLCLPLKSKNKTVGVLYLDNRCQTNAFEKANIKLLSAYCDQVGIALENARLFQKYQEAQSKLQAELEKTAGELEEVKEILMSEGADFRTKYSYSHIIAKSKPMREIFKVLDKITETNLSVFISGASGTGKELIAKAMHYNNPQRSTRRFIAINCGAIPANLIESELFGYKAGSFTGAQRDKKGLFEEANGGTIFLDEIAELEPPLQVKLLRVLQEGEVRRIGETTSIKIDVRVISASHKNLDEMLSHNTFREDLYYRLCQIKIGLPTLSQRKEDIPLLVDHFIEKFKKENDVKEKIKSTPTLMKAFFQYNWPGNIRELENVINVACALRHGNELDINTLPQNYSLMQSFKQKTPSGLTPVKSNHQNNDPLHVIPIDEQNTFDPSKTWQDYETVIIAKCFEKNNFKKGIASSMLGISASTFYKKIKDHDLENKQNPVYEDRFTYQENSTLKSYIPKIFKASLQYNDNHPYSAIRQLAVSQGYFYKVIKQEGAA